MITASSSQPGTAAYLAAPPPRESGISASLASPSLPDPPRFFFRTGKKIFSLFFFPITLPATAASMEQVSEGRERDSLRWCLGARLSRRVARSTLGVTSTAARRTRPAWDVSPRGADGRGLGWFFFFFFLVSLPPGVRIDSGMRGLVSKSRGADGARDMDSAVVGFGIVVSRRGAGEIGGLCFSKFNCWGVDACEGRMTFLSRQGGCCWMGRRWIWLVLQPDGWLGGLYSELGRDIKIMYFWIFLLQANKSEIKNVV